MKAIKKIIPMLLFVCLIMQVIPLAVGAVAQEPVLKDGAEYDDVTTYAGNSSANLGDKITANGAKYDIKLDGEKVGSFVFNKNSQYIEITITENVAVDILWNCANKYADCTLNGVGIYKIPQLLQDNGKTQSFNAIWLVDVSQGDNTASPVGTWECFAYGTYGDHYVFVLDFTETNQVKYMAGWYMSEIAALFSGQYTIENGNTLTISMTGFIIMNTYEFIPSTLSGEFLFDVSDDKLTLIHQGGDKLTWVFDTGIPMEFTITEYEKYPVLNLI
jgi:hypothetical protein